MKYILTLITVAILGTTFAQKTTFFDFSTKTIDGRDVNLSEYKGRKIMVVNVASKCGLTPQYEQLEALYEQYSGEKFIILAFPANNFGGQEPGTNAEIKEFCKANYGVTFPIMQKISVKGDDIDPIYAWLTQKNQNGVMDAKVTWNFQKFLIDEKGKLVDVVSPKEKPDCDKIVNWIKK